MDLRMRGRTILLVEDDAHDEELIRMALGDFRLRNELVVVRDGAAAVKHLVGTVEPRRLAVRRLPDLILIDASRPDVGGLELIQRLRADPQMTLVPVVVMSESGEPADVRASYRAGANSYVRKPVGFQGFTEAVRALSVYWLLMNRPAHFHG
jgi:two-component system response regulator